MGGQAKQANKPRKLKFPRRPKFLWQIESGGVLSGTGVGYGDPIIWDENWYHVAICLRCFNGQRVAQADPTNLKLSSKFRRDAEKSHVCGPLNERGRRDYYGG